jgi:flavin reductase (DIM6/NTAB) family NADH-FMN oxidoreductase RutF
MSSKPDERPRVAPDLFRRACSRFATGVTVITVLDEDGHPHGITVNSFASVSLEPPLVAVSIDRRNALLGHFLSRACFSVNVLAENQEPLSRRFSSASENRFHGVEWRRSGNGAPLIPGALAYFDCGVIQTMEIGDHFVLIGEVTAAEYSVGKPLIFFDSSYQRL